MGKRVALAVLLLAVVGVAGCGDDSPAQPAVDAGTHDTEAAPPTVEIPSWAKVAPEQIAEAKKHGVPVAFENDLGMRFVLIPAGTFVMGLPEDEEWRGDDAAQRAVTVKEPYYVQDAEVTNAEFRRFRQHREGDFDGFDADVQPVVLVTWDDAVAFANWMSGRDAERTYSLPTEIEWERACRAGTATAYEWGEGGKNGHKRANAADPETLRLYGVLYEDETNPAWAHDDGHHGCAPVRSYPPSRWGLHDMHGNVWEWCAEPPGSQVDEDEIEAELVERIKAHAPAGTGTASTWPNRRIFSRPIRGGSWTSPPGFLRAGFGFVVRHNLRESDTGFRLVSPLPEPKRGK